MTRVVPIEIRVGEELAVRGHELDDVGPPVVFVHEPGADLDAWGSVPAWFAARGFKVITLDLPGHGLSDGEPGDVESMLADAISEIRQLFGPIGVAAAGGSCRSIAGLGADDGVPVQVLISPTPIDKETLAATEWAIRLVMCGPGDRQAHAETKTVFDGLRGQKVLITGGGADQGSHLVRTHQHLAEELVMWFRRYLTPYHLSWIADIERARSNGEHKEA